MANYRTEIDNPIPLILLVPTYNSSSGVDYKTFPTIEESLNVIDDFGNPVNVFYGSFKTYGGKKERDKNGLWLIEDTAKIKTWFRPDIQSDCRIGVLEDNSIYEIFGEPEDINKRHQFLEFEIRRYKGKI